MNEENKSKKEGTKIIKLFGAQIEVQIDDKSLDNMHDLNNKRSGKSWSEDEHRSFLEGLEKLGKGDWKSIATNYVPSRTPTQIASHAQKYFIRQSADKMKRRRASVFDISPPHRNQESNEADENSLGSCSAAVVSKNVTEFQEQPSITANVARTTSEKAPLSLVNGPGIYQHASLSSSTKGYPAHMLVPGWIAVDQGSRILGFVPPPFAVLTTNYNELNHNNDKLLGDTVLRETGREEELCETGREKVLRKTDPNNGKILGEMVLSETKREEVLCETCRKPVLHETSNETDLN